MEEKFRPIITPAIKHVKKICAMPVVIENGDHDFIYLFAGPIEEIISMAEKCGAALHVNALIPAGRARNHPEISLTREGNEIVYQFLKERKKKFAHIFTGLILKEMWTLVSFSGRYVLVMCLTKIFLLLLRRHKRLVLFTRVSRGLKGR